MVFINRPNRYNATGVFWGSNGHKCVAVFLGFKLSMFKTINASLVYGWFFLGGPSIIMADRLICLYEN